VLAVGVSVVGSLDEPLLLNTTICTELGASVHPKKNMYGNTLVEHRKSLNVWRTAIFTVVDRPQLQLQIQIRLQLQLQ